jgi:hypothetical protein
MYGAFTSNVDMRSGAPAFGTPENAKANVASGARGASLALDGLSVASPPSAHGDIEVRLSSIGRASIKSVGFSGPAQGVIRIAPEVSGSMTVRAAAPAVRIDNRSTRLRLIDDAGGKGV